MKIIVKNGVVVASSNSASVVSNGIQLDDTILGIPCSDPGKFLEELPDIFDVVELPDGFKQNKFTYAKGVFGLNPSYVEFVTNEEKIDNLAHEQQEISNTIAELIMGV